MKNGHFKLDGQKIDKFFQKLKLKFENFKQSKNIFDLK